MAANQVPEPQAWPGTIDMLDEAQGIQTLRLTAEQRQEKLFEKLDLSSLESWSPEPVDSTHSLQAEYYNIFSLVLCKAITILDSFSCLGLYALIIYVVYSPNFSCSSSGLLVFAHLGGI